MCSQFIRHMFSLHKVKRCIWGKNNFFCSLETSKVSYYFQGNSNTLLLYINPSLSCVFLLNLLCSLPLTVPGHSTECYESSETTTKDADLWSREMNADESLKMSHQTIESLLLGVGSQLQNEDYLTGISCRLQTALERMLMVISDTSNQVQSSSTHKSHLLYFELSFHTPTF